MAFHRDINGDEVETGVANPLPTTSTDASTTNENLGAKADAVASSDTGTFSLIALFKRLLQGITTLFGNQTNATQKTQVVDGSGNVIGSTGNALQVNVKAFTAVSRTPTLAIETGSTNSPVPAGANSITFITSSDFAGTLLTQVIAVSSSYTFSANNGDALGAFAFTVTAGSLTIMKLV